MIHQSSFSQGITQGYLRRGRRSFSKEGKAATAAGGARAATGEIPTAGATRTKAEVPGEGRPGREEVHRLGEEGGESERIGKLEIHIRHGGLLYLLDGTFPGWAGRHSFHSSVISH